MFIIHDYSCYSLLFSLKIIYIKLLSVGLSPLPVTVANEGFFWDPLLKMFHNPGGDSYWAGGTIQTISVVLLLDVPES